MYPTSSYPNPAYPNPAYPNPAHPSPAHPNPAYPNPAYTNNELKEQPYPPSFINQPPPPYYIPPGPMPTQPNVLPMVVTTEQYVVAMPQRAYRDYMGLSILTFVLFCWPIGIAAWIHSSKARQALCCGDLVMAAQYSASARRLNIIGIVIGCCCHVAWIAGVIYYSTTQSYYPIYVYG